MKHIFKSPWTWCIFAGAALFALSGLIIRGNALNAVPGGVIGWIFWGVLAVLAWHFLLSPLVGFIGLPKWRADVSDMSDYDRLLFLERYANSIIESYKNARKENALLDERLRAVESALCEMNTGARLSELQKSVDAFRECLEKDVCRGIISAHMKYAAVAVVVSQRGFLDSLVVFAVQVKLIIALSRALGHRPSWAFVSCCMVWVVTNSLLSLIFDESNITEGAVSSVGEILGIKGGGIFSEVPGLKTLASLIMQATTAAVSVYVTGALVRSRLLGDSRKKTLKELLKLRLNGYKEAGCIAKELIGNVFSNKTSEAKDLPAEGESHVPA